MISIQKLFGKDDKFFNLLEASAEEAQASVQALKRLLAHPHKTPSLEEFVQSRRKDKHITNEISEHLIKSFVTALEREDIQVLSQTLYQVPKTVEKFAERFIICQQHIQGVAFGRQLAILEKATDQVLVMVKYLRKGSHLEKIKDENVELQRLEGEADKLILELLGNLYSGQHDVFRVIALKDLYELLEKVIDRCRDAGNVVSHIILKHA